MNAILRRVCLSVVCGLGITGVAFAAPANDSFSSPKVLTGLPVTVVSNNVDATLQTNEPLPSFYTDYAEASVWFSWTATNSQSVQIDTTNSSIDTILAVWRGTNIANLTLLAQNDDGGGSVGVQSRIYLNVTNGHNYRIAVYGYGEDNRGNIALNISKDTTSKITGKVTRSNGTTPIEDVQASIYSWDGVEWAFGSSVTTGTNGVYTFSSIVAGTYRVFFEDNNGLYISKAYTNATSVEAGTDIAVPASATISNINVSLQRYATISGKVTQTNRTTVLEGIQVTAYQTNGLDWEVRSESYTDAGGLYTLTGLAPGSYRVGFVDWSGDYATQVYSNALYIELGTNINVAAEATVTNINAAMKVASKLSGKLTGPTNGPIEYALVEVYRQSGTNWLWVRSSNTDPLGDYTVGGLPAGSYRVYFVDQSYTYQSEYYTNAFSITNAKTITLGTGVTSNNINASLSYLSKISGKVTGPNATNIADGVTVIAYRWTGTQWDVVTSALTDGDGEYVISQLPVDTYRIGFFDDAYQRYSSEYYNNASDVNSGTNIVVPADTTVSNINASLSVASSISGKITRSDGSTPIGNVEAIAYKWDGTSWVWVNNGYSDTDGQYLIGRLQAATYRVGFFDGSWQYLGEYYNNAPSVSNAANIVVASETTVTNINASLLSYSSISGKVTGPGGTPNLIDIVVRVYQFNGSWQIVDEATTDSYGDYTINGLLAGTYRVDFDDPSDLFVYEAYNNATNVNVGANIIVAAETSVTGVDASLALAPSVASSISGKITRSNGSTPIEGVEVLAYRWDGADWVWVSSGYSGTNGMYTIGGLLADTYRLQFLDGSGGYIQEYYNNAAAVTNATDVVVPTATAVTNINASLLRFSSISGTVTGPGGATNLADIVVRIYQFNGSWQEIQDVSTDVNGSYTFSGLVADTYRVDFDDPSGVHLYEAYNNATNVSAGTNIIVAAEASVTNINVSLARASISGKITRSNGSTPIQGVEAIAYQWNGVSWAQVSNAYSGADGTYTIGVLRASTNRLRFVDGSGNYIEEYYNNATAVTNATDVVVPTAAAVTNINASLVSYSSISGTVTGPSGTNKLTNIVVRAYRYSGSWQVVTQVSTDTNGSYTISGLVADTYRVDFNDLSGVHLYEAYNNATNVSAGTNIIVAADTAVTGINASLALTTPPEPSRIGALTVTGGSNWVITYVGTVGRSYILQEVSALTNTWGDVGSSFVCLTPTSTVSRTSSAPVRFWRIREYP
ncbi:MAG: hypothetical protein FJ220_00440 [Kiritimatiellaceae bacterium]|nr:hypothetical protein [Kiritimatiellaceae bacterium]